MEATCKIGNYRSASPKTSSGQYDHPGRELSHKQAEDQSSIGQALQSFMPDLHVWPTSSSRCNVCASAILKRLCLIPSRSGRLKLCKTAKGIRHCTVQAVSEESDLSSPLHLRLITLRLFVHFDTR